MPTNPAVFYGFSFIEMLIALAIFSIILLALNQSEFQNSQITTQDYFSGVALNTLHNAYEQSQWMDGNGAMQQASKKLPQGEGEISSSLEHIYIEVSWTNRFSEQKNQLCVDI